MADIYIASRQVSESAAVFEHLYLVYDPDGNPNSGDEQILRAGPSEGVNSPILIESTI